MGCDGALSDLNTTAKDLNPRIPHGVRLEFFRYMFPLPHLNPRTPHGVRLYAILFSTR